MHLLSQILILVHIMLLSRDITLLSLFFPEVRWCLLGINEEKLGGSDIRGGQPGLGGIQTPGVERRQSQGRTVQGTHHRLHRAFLQCGVTSWCSSAHHGPLCWPESSLSSNKNAGHDFLTPWYCLMNSYGLSAVLFHSLPFKCILVWQCNACL